MGFETLKNILDWNKAEREAHPQDEDLENNICPYCAWQLAENSEGQKSCEVCGRIYK